MRVLLKKGSDAATSTTILVLPQGLKDSLETLSGELVEDAGVLSEATEKTVIDALNAGVRARKDGGWTKPKEVMKDLRWLDQALSPWEIGSVVGIEPTARGVKLDTTQATPINRAKNLRQGDLVAIGPSISPKVWLNARGKVQSIQKDKVAVQLDPGDRDRVERASGKEYQPVSKFPIACVEKID